MSAGVYNCEEWRFCFGRRDPLTGRRSEKYEQSYYFVWSSSINTCIFNRNPIATYKFILRYLVSHLYLQVDTFQLLSLG